MMTQLIIFLSQELICEFHTMLNSELPSQIKLFEDILYSFIGDIQKYKKDIVRLEDAYKK
jgi:hypothetical protein